MEDRRLLRRFVEENSQEAFAALTARHLGLVYSVCRRELDDADLAEDVTQAVFLILARKAPSLRREVVLSGWLFQTARFAARNARTQARRRAAYEQKAAEAMEQQQSEPAEGSAWAEIEPLLNQSLAALKDAERQGVLLRFFQQMTFAEIGASLGLSEEAARKRVTRALDKMRRFLDARGVIVPGVALSALLSAHAARAVPVRLAGAVAATLAGAAPAHVSLITGGILHSMKIIKLKVAAGAAALLVTGAVAYAVARGGPTKPSAAKPISLDALINEGPPLSGMKAPGPKDAARNVVLAGKIRYEDGRPAGGVRLAAQIQSKLLDDILDASKKRLGLSDSQPYRWSDQEREESGNNAVTTPGGTYTLPVGSGVPYNVMVFDTTGKWVAQAIEGASGPRNSTVKLPDLVLTRGAIVTGTVMDGRGRPVPGVMVGSYGPHRPASSPGFISVTADQHGQYRLRVAPGVSRIYLASGPGSASRDVTVAPGVVETVDLVQ